MATLLVRVVLACVAYYVGAVVLLHVLSPDVHPLRQFMSEFAVGRFGLLMSATFFALSAASLSLCVALLLLRRTARPSWTGLVLLSFWAAMICVAGIFPTDPDGGPRSASGLIHGRASMLGFTSIAIGMLFLSVGFRKEDSVLRPISSTALLLAIGVLLAFVGIMAGSPYPGLLQRIFLACVLSWHAIVAWSLAATIRRQALTVATRSHHT